MKFPAGIDSTTFNSTAASTPAAAKKHLPLYDIIKLGDWTLACNNFSTFLL